MEQESVTLDHQPPSDRDLVADIADGDRGALHELFTRHQPWLAARVRQRCNDPEIVAEVVTLPLAGNARAKMQGVRDGFVKLFCRPGTGIVVGGVVVGPRASELIHPVSIAVAESLTADQLAHAFTVYPSMSGSIAEAARRLHRV